MNQWRVSRVNGGGDVGIYPKSFIVKELFRPMKGDNYFSFFLPQLFCFQAVQELQRIKSDRGGKPNVETFDEADGGVSGYSSVCISKGLCLAV